MKSIIKVITVDEHYEIYVKGEFYCSCDANELSSVINEIDKTFINND